MSAALDDQQYDQQQNGQSSQDQYGAPPGTLSGQDPMQVPQQTGQTGLDPGQFGQQGTPLGTDSPVERTDQGGMPDLTQQTGGQFDQGVAGQAEQQVTQKVDSAIDEGATGVPSGDQLARPTQPAEQQPGGQDGQGVVGQMKQQATQGVDSAIDDAASRAPGGDQFAEQAKQQADSAIDNAAQQAQQDDSHGGGGLGAIGEKLREMFGGGHDQNP